MKQVCVLFAEGFEEVEALTVVDLLRRAEVRVTLAAVSEELEVTGANGITVKADTFFKDVKLADLDLLVLPGGMPGTTNLERCETVRDAIASLSSKGQLIAAICAAPAILLGKAGYLKGRKATCYPGMESFLEGALAVQEPVVRDGSFITSRGIGTAVQFALYLIETLCGKETAIKTAESVVSSWK